MNIALALSGGGFRATVFHLGVLDRLARENRLEAVNFLSTVSGGSLCTGMVFALNGMRWPSSQEYLDAVAPQARHLLTTIDLQSSLIRRVLSRFWSIAQTRADDLSALMQQHWGITAQLNELPPKPRWLINATCYETGKNWRFERFRMGDFVFGYSYNTDLPLSDAMAASAGFPGLIGPMVIDTTRHSWFQYTDRSGNATLMMDPEQEKQHKTQPVQPMFEQVHLWDGGVYDNHGLEGLHDFSQGWREGIDFLIVSDAAGRATPEEYHPGARALTRIITGIMMNQIRSLRSRAIIARLVDPNSSDRGSFLQTGNTCGQVLKAAGRGAEIAEKCPGCLSDEEARQVAEMATVIRKLSDDEFNRLYRHGYEVADYTLYAYNSADFNYLGFQGFPWD